MILDSSAAIAIINNEAERNEFQRAVATSSCVMSSVTYLETAVVLLNRRGESSLLSLDDWIEASRVDVVPFTPAQARLARQAYARYGKGRRRAGFNFGDCASYALAIDRGDDLLFKGDDFGLTDVRPAKTLD